MIMNFSGVMIWLKTAIKILTPFFYGFIIAFLLNIPCSALESNLKKSKLNILVKKSRMISILIVYVLLFVIIAITINLIIPSLQRNVTDFIVNFNTYYNNVILAIQQLPIANTEELDAILETLMNKISLKVLLESIGLTNILSSLNDVFGFTSVIFSGIVAIITSIYLLVERHNFKNYINHVSELLLSRKTRGVIYRYGNIISESFKKFIACQLLDSCILGVITTIEFSILGSRHAVALVLSLVPLSQLL
jgi:predicted PurR-regulated permease PerM